MRRVIVFTLVLALVLSLSTVAFAADQLRARDRDYATTPNHDQTPDQDRTRDRLYEDGLCVPANLSGTALAEEINKLQELRQEARQLQKELRDQVQAAHQHLVQLQDQNKLQALQDALPQLKALHQLLNQVRSSYSEGEAAVGTFQHQWRKGNVGDAEQAVQQAQVAVQARIQSTEQALKLATQLHEFLHAALGQ